MGTITLDVAPTKEQGVNFVVVAVSRQVLDKPRDQADFDALLRSEFGPVAIVFMAQDADGTPTYFGNQDIVEFLSTEVVPDDLPWQRLTLSDT